MDTPTVAHPSRILPILLLGAAVTSINISVTNVAAPSIARALDATSTEIGWIVDGYTVAFAALVLVGGAVGDRYGRSRAFVYGAVLMVPAAALAAWAASPGALISARVASGLAGGLLFPATLSLITDAYPEPSARRRAIATWSGTVAATSASGPVVSGLLVTYFWWGSVFLVTVPLAIATALLGRRMLPADPEPDSHPPVDWIGGLFAAVTVALTLFVVIESPVHGVTGSVAVAAQVAIASFVGFIIWERRTRHPLIALEVFSNRRFSVASVCVSLAALVLLGTMYLVAQYVQNVLGYSPARAGFAALPLSAMMLAVSPASARLDERFGTRRVVTAGLLTVASGLALVLTWSVDSPYALIALSLGVVGTGLGLAFTPATNAIMGSVPPDKAGVGSAMNDLTREVGGALGIAVFGSIVTLRYQGYFREALESLPPEDAERVSADLAETISESLTGALEAAKGLAPQDADRVVDAARQAFLDGQSLAVAIGVGITLAAAALAWWKLPSEPTSSERSESSVR